MTSKPKLEAFGKDLWVIDGPRVRDMGILFTTRMAVARLADGSLWLESPVPLPFETLQEITALGTVRYLVAATPRHVWRLEGWHTLFPEAELWTARITPFTLGKASLQFTGTLGDAPAPGWAGDLDQVAFKGSPWIEEVLFYHKESRTVILDDLVMVHPMLEGRPVRNALFKLDGVASPYGGVSLDIRMTFTDRKEARRSLERVLAWDFDRLILAHGPCIEKDAKQFLERAFRWLARR